MTFLAVRSFILVLALVVGALVFTHASTARASMVTECDWVRQSATAGTTVRIELGDLGCVSSDGSPITYEIISTNFAGHPDGTAEVSGTDLVVEMPSYGTDDFRVSIGIEARNACNGGQFSCYADEIYVTLLVDGTGIYPDCGPSVVSQDWVKGLAISVPEPGTVAPEKTLKLSVQFGEHRDRKTSKWGHVGGLRLNGSIVTPRFTAGNQISGQQTFSYPASTLAGGVANVQLDLLVASSPAPLCWVVTSEAAIRVTPRGVRWEVFESVDIGDPFVHFNPRVRDCEGYSDVAQRVTLTHRRRSISIPIGPQCSEWALDSGSKIALNEVRKFKMKCVRLATFEMCRNRVRRDITINPRGAAYRRLEVFRVVISSPVSRQEYRCTAKPVNVIMMPTGYSCRQVLANGI